MEYALGVVVSLIVQAVKKYLGTSGLGSYAVLAVISLVGATLYVFFSSLSFWPVIIQVIIVAAAFHNLLIRPFQSQAPQ
jgi:hypothetical protein